MSHIHFFEEDIDFKPEHSSQITKWLNDVITVENHTLVELNYIFCSDEYLYQMNVDYLDHDTYTDIITFDNSESEEEIEGDIFISIDRIKENSQSMAISFQEELHRVIAHGLLHLLGYNDKTEEEKAMMRKKEEACLSLLPKL
ncbi:rRNA maturation RNase YbeY [Fulvivirga lutimaris]|uniref:rRNA maturation RNase YbeY n=1 Tax=Fulvivirga lutimaris TaxID=1819566 RepID=UPI0012BBF339|nr:rRNA maturation RNase YbeY [Fulvivirga lutimaris]MTI41039.1 rRNA maturation RNase YbeY [Fulvivirga lutimaris]